MILSGITQRRIHLSVFARLRDWKSGKRDSDRGYKVAGSCNEEDCKQLEELLFALDNQELGEIDLVTHNIGTSNANPVQILPRRLPSV